MTGTFRTLIIAPGNDPGVPLADVAHTIQTAFAEHAGRLDPPSGALSENEETVRRRCQHQTLVALLTPAGELVACGFLAKKADALYLDRVSVRPAWQGRGLVKSLVEVACEEARQSGKLRIDIGVRLVLERNIQVFRHLGFVETGRQAHAGYDAPTSMDMSLFID